MAVLIGLLWIPVLGDRLNDVLSKHAPKVAPRMLLVGLGFLLTGLVIGVQVLAVVGACLVGVLVLALILDNY
ncbi:MAG TPA: hypothetical protein VEM58_12625 [Streptosporangiaceae bacterium]|nr:hypothetical protein [Streptosporangiaceae bacterium]